jgi:hypothetical protein
MNQNPLLKRWAQEPWEAGTICNEIQHDKAKKKALQ